MSSGCVFAHSLSALVRPLDSLSLLLSDDMLEMRFWNCALALASARRALCHLASDSTGLICRRNSQTIDETRRLETGLLFSCAHSPECREILDKPQVGWRELARNTKHENASEGRDQTLALSQSRLNSANSQTDSLAIAFRMTTRTRTAALAIAWPTRWPNRGSPVFLVDLRAASR